MVKSKTSYEHIETGILIIGAGASGLRAAIELTNHQVPCLVIGKRSHGDAHTVMAAGGINAALAHLDKEDSWEIHAADTIKEGHFVCQPRAVELLAKESPARVLELQKWGCEFNLTNTGKINQRYFGAQSFRRTCFVGDVTGKAILDTLVKKGKERKIPYQDQFFVSKLLVKEGRVHGAVGYKLATGALVVIESQAVLLAAGGYTGIYPRCTSRRSENSGDAVALAYEAGAILRDMEFVQFHPTGVVSSTEGNGRLVTEAVRGEGGRLYNANSERFMQRYSPEHMELDARDVVARSIYQEIQEGRGTANGAVLLDISHQEKSFIHKRLPKLVEQSMQLGIDITKEPLEVAPTAHYSMGGIRVDCETGMTNIEGLFAVGEASSGVHGANRLGGNSLAETLVFGKLTGTHLLEYYSKQKKSPWGEVDVSAINRSWFDDAMNKNGKHSPSELIEQIGNLLWECAGIVRTKKGIETGLAHLNDIAQRAKDLQSDGSDSFKLRTTAINLHFILISAEAILRGALLREESRGAHFRQDFPKSSALWQKNIHYVKDEDGSMRLWTEEVPSVATEIRQAMQSAQGVNYHLLE